jgi:hypothetical protein
MNVLHIVIFLLVIIIGGFTYFKLKKSTETFSLLTLNNAGDLVRDDTIILGDNDGISNIKTSNSELTISGKVAIEKIFIEKPTGGYSQEEGDTTVDETVDVVDNLFVTMGNVTVKELCFRDICIDESHLKNLKRVIEYPTGYFDAAFYSNSDSLLMVNWNQLIKTKNFTLTSNNKYHEDDPILGRWRGNFTRPSQIAARFGNNSRKITVELRGALGRTRISDLKESRDTWLDNANNLKPVPIIPYNVTYFEGVILDPGSATFSQGVNGFGFKRDKGVNGNGYVHVRITYS